jgi:hypothetical protein
MATINVTPPISGYSSTSIQKILDKTGTYNGTPLQYSEIHFTKGKYVFNSRMYFNSNTKLTCDEGVYFELASTNFGIDNPVFGQKETAITGLDVSGFNYNGNYKSQPLTTNDHGLGYGTLINLKNITNSNFHDLKGGYSEGDFIKCSFGSGVHVYNCKVTTLGHDFVHFNVMKSSRVHHNYVETRADNAVRVRSSQNVEIDNNEFIGTDEAYAPIIQIESITKNYYLQGVYVHNNKLSNSLGPAIWAFGTVPNNTDIQIYNNLIVNCGLMPQANDIPGEGAIVTDGITGVKITFNTIDKCRNGVYIGKYQAISTYSGSVEVAYNIITNTMKPFDTDACSGAAIGNMTGTRNAVNVHDNCLFGNVSNYYKVTGTDDLYVDPCYVGSGDYHLKSKAGRYSSSGLVYDSVSSPCVFEENEWGYYNGSAECSEYFYPPTSMSPDDIVGDHSAVIIICQTEDEATQLSIALKKSEILDGQKVTVYSPY